MSKKDTSRFEDTTLQARKERVARLRDELNAQLDLVCYSREALERDMKVSLDIDAFVSSVDHLKKLKELTSCFTTLTDARIRLIKAEKQYEDDMTPEDELNAVRAFVRSMDSHARRGFIGDLVHQYETDHKSGGVDWSARGSR